MLKETRSELRNLKKDVFARFQELEQQIKATNETLLTGFQQTAKLIEGIKVISKDVDEQAATLDLLKDKIRVNEDLAFRALKEAKQIKREVDELKEQS